jgi:hypothetical protein
MEDLSLNRERSVDFVYRARFRKEEDNVRLRSRPSFAYSLPKSDRVVISQGSLTVFNNWSGFDMKKYFALLHNEWRAFYLDG